MHEYDKGLSWRVRQALERGLQSGVGSAAARQRGYNHALEPRVEGWEGELRSSLDCCSSVSLPEIRRSRSEAGVRPALIFVYAIFL